MVTLGAVFLPITREDIITSANLPRHHADPFDRILVAQAQSHALLLVTRDAEIARYGVPILWD